MLKRWQSTKINYHTIVLSIGSLAKGIKRLAIEAVELKSIPKRKKKIRLITIVDSFFLQPLCVILFDKRTSIAQPQHCTDCLIHNRNCQASVSFFWLNPSYITEDRRQDVINLYRLALREQKYLQIEFGHGL